MASACVNKIGMTPENFPAGKYPSYGWLSPRASFSREFPDEDSSKTTSGPTPPPLPPEIPDLEIAAGDFEFRLEDPVTMLPADELFSDGKLVPLHLSAVKPSPNVLTSAEIGSPETAKCRRRPAISGTESYLFSPKAPSCSSRWKELLGLKKLYQNANLKNETQKTSSFSSSSSSCNPNPKSLKYILHRSSKSSISSLDSSITLPLLRDSDGESISISSSRLSLSSSSSGHEHDDLPRLSLDFDKPNPNPFKNLNLNPNPNPNPNPPRMRLVKPTATVRVNRGRTQIRESESESNGVMSRGVSVDSPRMNSSGKIVFQSLERSSSSPSSFNGGPKFKHRGMERSYSTNVRVTPVLNMPICSSLRGSSKSVSVFGFGPLFSSSPQKKDTNGGNTVHHHVHHHHHHRQSSANNIKNH